MSHREPTGAQPMPSDGRRLLSGAEAQRRASAIACMRKKGSKCQGQVEAAGRQTVIRSCSMYTDGVE